MNRGKIHKYLGMTLDYTVSGQVKIIMIEYLRKILAAFEKAYPKSTGTKTSTAPDNLFVVNEETKKLSTEKAVQFNNLVAKMLYTTKCARTDTCTSIALLITRVKEPDLDDWAKLSHLMRYI